MPAKFRIRGKRDAIASLAWHMTRCEAPSSDTSDTWNFSATPLNSAIVEWRAAKGWERRSWKFDEKWCSADARLQVASDYERLNLRLHELAISLTEMLTSDGIGSVQ